MPEATRSQYFDSRPDHLHVVAGEPFNQFYEVIPGQPLPVSFKFSL